jgi:hypothetical protein
MVKLFLPIILIGAAAVLFMFYTNPAYQTIKDLSLQQDSYNSALDKAQELHTLRDQLLAKRNSFSNDSLDKLHHVLPDNVDNIRLIIDINNIASRHNLALNNVDLGTLIPFDLRYIPEESARHYRFAPLGRIADGVLEVGVTDPDNLEARDALTFISAKVGMPYKLFFISDTDFDKLCSAVQRPLGRGGQGARRA